LLKKKINYILQKLYMDSHKAIGQHASDVIYVIYSLIM